MGPGQTARLVRASSPYAEVVLSRSGHIRELTDEFLNNWSNKPMFLSLFLPLSKKKVGTEKMKDNISRAF